MKNPGEKFKLFSEHFQSISVSSCEALATFAAYASYPALDCLSQNFVQCGQAIMYVHILSYIIKKVKFLITSNFKTYAGFTLFLAVCEDVSGG